nr:DUF1365 domain-containing protein [Saccharopolyspora spinosa]
MYLYDVVVGHTRHCAPQRSFQHRLYTWLVDLDALPNLPYPLRVLARFEARDHLGDPRRTIRENLDRWLARHDVNLRGGRVLMLAHARVLGYVFNPVTIYWCHQPDGNLECIVAEVHNTYGERHCYLVHPDAAGTGETDKQLYVSPFLPDQGSYRMRLPLPGERLRLHIDLLDGNRTLLTATMHGRRQPATPSRLLRSALRRPLVPHSVAALIRRHGIALWLRRAPQWSRQPHSHQDGVR